MIVTLVPYWFNWMPDAYDTGPWDLTSLRLGSARLWGKQRTPQSLQQGPLPRLAPRVDSLLLTVQKLGIFRDRGDFISKLKTNNVSAASRDVPKGCFHSTMQPRFRSLRLPKQPPPWILMLPLVSFLPPVV